jgi:YidC/Oxa1 family membrane protein insertase
MAMNDNQKKQDTQKRILVATLLSFAFFIAYDFFYLQPQQNVAQNNTQQTINANNKDTNIAPNINLSTNKRQNAIPNIKNIKKETIVSTITTTNSIYEIDSLGRIAQVTLLQKKYIDNDNNALKIFNAQQLRPLEVRFSDAILNKEAFLTTVTTNAKTLDTTSTAKTLTITQKLSSTTLIKTLKFYPDGHYDLDIQTSNNQNYFITPGYRPDIAADMYADHGALLIKNDGTLNIIEDEDMDSTVDLFGMNAISAFDRYYTTVLYNFDKNMQVSVMKNKENSPESFIHIDTKGKLHGYAGPKEYDLIKSFDSRLTDIIEYGWFTFIAKPMFTMLNYIYGIVGNWGWTIVLTTILIKLVLSPLSHKGMVSMNRLKELTPKVKAIQEKYKDDKQKASMHMMELYKKEGANPLGGCLPILMQIPVFFAIYRVLLNSIELKGAEWIWFVQDLTHTVSISNLLDPYIIIPLIMGGTMFLQQKITPNQIQDEVQRKVFMMLPFVFTIFFLFFEAGLVLYWTINNIFTISQQYYINNMFAQNGQTRKIAHDAKKSDKTK